MSKVKYEPHTPIKIKQIPWQYCKYCGLIYLRNEATAKAIKQGHEADE